MIQYDNRKIYLFIILFYFIFNKKKIFLSFYTGGIMAYKTLEHSDLNLFKNRLWKLMEEKEIYTAKDLAKKLYDEGYVSVRQKESDDEPSTIYGRAIGSIEKKIQKHLNSNDAEKLQGEFVIAYCKFFECSADYLFGKIECKTHDDEFIHSKTGLSEIAILELRQLHARTVVFREDNYDLDIINALIEQLNHKNNSVLHWLTIYLYSKGLEKDLWYYTESGTISEKKYITTEAVIHLEKKSDTFDNLILTGLENRIKALKSKLSQ